MRFKLPDSPGCYLFRDSAGEIVYIGKAKSLKKRVAGHFSARATDARVLAMRSRVRSVDYIATGNETEALVLEANLVRKHQPRYNILLKDSKSFAYLQLTSEDFPRLVVVRRERLPRAFGPFTSAEERDSLLRLAQRLFRLRTCRKMPKRPCLRYHISLCTAPCAGLVSKADYAAQAARAARMLSGQIDALIKDMQQDMELCAKRLMFEQALILRKQLDALTHLKEKQNMQRSRTYDEDIIYYIQHEGRIHLLLFNVHRGTLLNKQEFDFGDFQDSISEFLVRLYTDSPVPKEIILQEPVDNAVRGFLESKRPGVRLTVPVRGEKRQLLELAQMNLELGLFADNRSLASVQRGLGLQALPSIIECIDISHLSGTAAAGSLVRFMNARPDKSGYRRFRIRSRGIDDYRAIAEVAARRYRRLRDEHQEMPDLLLIDGGPGQLSAVLSALRKLGLSLPVASIAKRFEEIYLPGQREPVRLSRRDPGLQLLMKIRDEAHRFAIKYNRLLRSRQLSGA